MALAGHGVAFLPHSAVEDAVDEGKPDPPRPRHARHARGPVHADDGDPPVSRQAGVARATIARQALVRAAVGRGGARSGARRGVPETCAARRELAVLLNVMQEKHNRIMKRHWISNRRFSTMSHSTQRWSVHVIPAARSAQSASPFSTSIPSYLNTDDLGPWGNYLQSGRSRRAVSRLAVALARNPQAPEAHSDRRLPYRTR